MGDGATIRCVTREYRRRKGLSQDELARLVGLRRQAVCDLEGGRYLPNTAVALRLARALGCTVEMLFVEDASEEFGGLHLLHDAEAATARLFLAQVREKLVGVPLSGVPLSFKLDVSDGFLLADKTVDCPHPRDQLADTVLILGCDPALDLLAGLMARTSPGIQAHAVFASSRRALLAVGDGLAHVAGYHGFDAEDGNLEAVRALLPGLDFLIFAFSVQEEGFMVAPGNPLGVRSVEDLARIRLVNREEGVLDSELSRLGMPVSGGCIEEARSHFEGAIRVAGGAADAALGLRIVAESLGLDFVPLATTRCDLVIPKDLRNLPGIAVLLDVLQSSRIRKELSALPGYDASQVGKVVLG